MMENKRQDGTRHTDARSPNNVRQSSLNQTQNQKSFSEIAGDSSCNVTNPITPDEVELDFSPAARTQFAVSPASERCLLVEKDILVEEPIDKKTDKQTKKRKQKPVDSHKNGEGKIVQISSAEEVVVEKQELLSIPETNFAIGLLVMFCFNPPFGLLALYFSLKAAAAYRDGNKVQGARCARTSIVISLLGIMLIMVVISSVVLYIAVHKHSTREGRTSSSSLGF